MSKETRKLKKYKHAYRLKKVSAHEFKKAKHLLTQASGFFKEGDMNVQAEYTLGILTYKEVNKISSKKDLETREYTFHVALARFIKVVGAYHDTSFGSKA